MKKQKSWYCGGKKEKEKGKRKQKEKKWSFLKNEQLDAFKNFQCACLYNHVYFKTRMTITKSVKTRTTKTKKRKKKHFKNIWSYFKVDIQGRWGDPSKNSLYLPIPWWGSLDNWMGMYLLGGEVRGSHFDFPVAQFRFQFILFSWADVLTYPQCSKTFVWRNKSLNMP